DAAGLGCGMAATAEVALNPLIATAQIRLPRNAFMVITPFTVELCAGRRADRRGGFSNPRTSAEERGRMPYPTPHVLARRATAEADRCQTSTHTPPHRARSRSVPRSGSFRSAG